MPFEDPNTAQLYKKILSGSFEIPKYVSSGARNLMKCILSTEPEKRYKAADVRQHPWFKQYNRNAVFIDKIDNDDIPINEEVLDMLEEYRFDKNLAEKYIRANKHNHETTTYYLLLKRYEKDNPTKKKPLQTSLQLETDDQNLTQPPKYPNNLSVSQRVNPDYLFKNQLNQTLPVTAKRNDDSFSANKIPPTSANVPIHKVYLETSKAEQMAGINVSYDNSFNAIKKDIQKTVARETTGTKEDVFNSTDYESQRKPKNIGEELPPNKPNEAIMISESLKVNERENRESRVTPPNVNMSLSARPQRNIIKEENQLNHTMPDEFNNSIEDMKGWTKLSAARDKEKSKNSNRGTMNSKTIQSNYKANKPKTSINTYGAAMPKKKEHVSNSSYSSRPKTSNYLSNIGGTSYAKKPQANSFLTQSLDTSKTPKQTESHAKKGSSTFDNSGRVNGGYKSPASIQIEDASSGVRQSKVSKTNFRTIDDNNSSSLRESDLLRSETQQTNHTDEMQIYRGPFSVSCSTTKDPSVVMNDMIRSLDLFSVSYQRLGRYFVK